jgi:hypothetical protein
MLRRAGIRTKHEDKTERHDVILFHGFCKFWNPAIYSARVEHITKEFMIGHACGLEYAYLRLHLPELWKEYKKAIMSLTIDQTEDLQNEQGIAARERRNAKETDKGNSFAQARL